MGVYWNPNNPRNQTPWNGRQTPAGNTPEQNEQFFRDLQHRQTAEAVRSQTGSYPDWYKK